MILFFLSLIIYLGAAEVTTPVSLDLSTETPKPIRRDGSTQLPNEGDLLILPHLFCRANLLDTNTLHLGGKISLNISAGRVGYNGPDAFKSIKTIEQKSPAKQAYQRKFSFSLKNPAKISMQSLSQTMVNTKSNSMNYYAVKIELAAMSTVSTANYWTIYGTSFEDWKWSPHLKGSASQLSFALKTLNNTCKKRLCFNIIDLLSKPNKIRYFEIDTENKNGLKEISRLPNPDKACKTNEDKRKLYLSIQYKK